MTALGLVLACAAHRAALEVAPAGSAAEVSSAPAPSAGTGGREAATIPYAEADIIGPLDVDDFDASLAAQIGRVSACYQEGLRARPDLAGIVKVRFVINGAGSGTSATAWESTLDDAGVES